MAIIGEVCREETAADYLDTLYGQSVEPSELEYVPEKLKNDPEVVNAAAKADPHGGASEYKEAAPHECTCKKPDLTKSRYLEEHTHVDINRRFQSRCCMGSENEFDGSINSGEGKDGTHSKNITTSELIRSNFRNELGLGEAFPKETTTHQLGVNLLLTDPWRK